MSVKHQPIGPSPIRWQSTSGRSPSTTSAHGPDRLDLSGSGRLSPALSLSKKLWFVFDRHIWPDLPRRAAGWKGPQQGEASLCEDSERFELRPRYNAVQEMKLLSSPVVWCSHIISRWLSDKRQTRTTSDDKINEPNIVHQKKLVFL